VPWTEGKTSTEHEIGQAHHSNSMSKGVHRPTMAANQAAQWRVASPPLVLGDSLADETLESCFFLFDVPGRYVCGAITARAPGLNGCAVGDPGLWARNQIRSAASCNWPDPLNLLGHLGCVRERWDASSQDSPFMALTFVRARPD
jgi:hypothetical protein